MDYDFSGWATKNDLLCSDGRTIRKNAFKDDNGKKVPLVWSHQHNSVYDVLGHAELENREEGVYAYCSFNDTESGKAAKELVSHGDVAALSIHAGRLKQKGSDVLHGQIREVSLVLCGANPGACITEVFSHGEGEEADAWIFHGEEDLVKKKKDEEESEGDEKKEEETSEESPEETKEEPSEEEESEETSEEDDEEKKKEINHADEESDKTLGEVFDTLNEDQKGVADVLIGMSLGGKDLKKQLADAEIDTNEMSEVLKTFSQEQLTALCAYIGMAAEDNEEPDDGGKETMKHNIFDTEVQSENVLSHADCEMIIKNAKRDGSFKNALNDYLEEYTLSHAVTDESGAEVTYGVADIDWLFPEAKSLNNPPEFLGQKKRAWVQEVMSRVHHNPFSRIKSVFADISMDEARAKGYIKGKRKKEEVFSLLKRTTTPQTVYKKQKLDRDDVIDITDFDIIPWIRGEMRVKLDEELARAFLIGDGRLANDEDKINESNIRPIWTDDELYSVHRLVEKAASDTKQDVAERFIDEVTAGMGDDYEGGGNAVLYVDPTLLSTCLLLKDGFGHRLYKTVDELATAMSVSKIVKVTPMKNLTRTVGSTTRTLMGIAVDLNDYYVGADKGGEINNFDDFDINFNQMIYLIETRCSGAMVVPNGALVFEQVPAAAATE